MNKITRNLKLGICAPFRQTKVNYKGKNNKTVKILANGPSLKKDMDTLLPTDDILVLNNFFLHENFFIYKPRFYVIVDNMYFEERFWRGMPDEKIYDIIHRIDWAITFFIPYRYLKYFKSKVKNPNVKIRTIYRYPIIHRFLPKPFEYFLYKKGITAPCSQNVLIPSIYAMINMGYSKIYLYGTDHSWTTQMLVNQSNQVCLSDHHFYDVLSSELTPWLKADGNPYRVHEVLGDLQRAFYGYHELNAYASYIGGVNIINMTELSFIDAFERNNDAKDSI